ncbi:M20 metallopeptidase family protein [Salirhabdus salicampi]|uniref:M20 metallopeptidase family protein n=1 Tax=Salirhabdus salicampi TaxID=476102 RepID=UPI0020C2654E|nr:M20 family metallopeptidase [Salirhabdus salicampi]MCP8615516.1 M20 family metallopeptidase [Salirhabdus salicampi]
MWNEIFEKIESSYQEMVDTRRYLHQHPELSFQEKHTSQFIAQQYEEWGIPYETNIGGYGVVATLNGGKDGKTVALRADFDALPIQDEKDVPYKSTVPGVMHACGHDGHTASLLGVAKALLPYQEDLPGTVVFLHQPAEEYAPGGAKPMIDDGALKGVDAVFGTHLWADAPVGVIQTTKGPFMAGADRFEITIKGKGGHGALPHQTKDAIVIGSQLVTQLQQIVSRRLDPLSTAVVTVGTFEAGQAFNVIADQARISGTVRMFDEDVQTKIIKTIENMVKSACLPYEADYELNYLKGYPPVMNHRKEAELILDGFTEVSGIERTEEILPVMGGEDFAYYLQHKPGAFYFTGAQKEGHVYPHHHPMFDFDERALPLSAKTLVQAYRLYQQENGYT